MFLCLYLSWECIKFKGLQGSNTEVGNLLTKTEGLGYGESASPRHVTLLWAKARAPAFCIGPWGAAVTINTMP